VTGYIEERAILGHGPLLSRTWRACADDVCVSRQSPRHPPCLEKCECLGGCNWIFKSKGGSEKEASFGTLLFNTGQPVLRQRLLLCQRQLPPHRKAPRHSHCTARTPCPCMPTTRGGTFRRV